MFQYINLCCSILSFTYLVGEICSVTEDEYSSHVQLSLLSFIHGRMGN